MRLRGTSDASSSNACRIRPVERRRRAALADLRPSQRPSCTVEYFGGSRNEANGAALPPELRARRDKILGRWADFVQQGGQARAAAAARRRARSTALRGADVDFGGADGGPLFSNVSWGVREGECVGVVGESGCGKSTQLRMLAGELAPAAGAVWRRDGIAVEYVPQDAPPRCARAPTRSTSSSTPTSPPTTRATRPRGAARRVAPPVPPPAAAV